MDDKPLNYKFQISTKCLDEITCQENVETVNGKKHKQLKGNYVESFSKGINVSEEMEIKLQKRNSALHENNKNVYLRINADCKSCPKNKPVHYVILIKKRPEINEKFVGVH